MHDNRALVDADALSVKADALNVIGDHSVMRKKRLRVIANAS